MLCRIVIPLLSIPEESYKNLKYSDKFVIADITIKNEWKLSDLWSSYTPFSAFITAGEIIETTVTVVIFKKNCFSHKTWFCTREERKHILESIYSFESCKAASHETSLRILLELVLITAKWLFLRPKILTNNQYLACYYPIIKGNFRG